MQYYILLPIIALFNNVLLNPWKWKFWADDFWKIYQVFFFRTTKIQPSQKFISVETMLSNFHFHFFIEILRWRFLKNTPSEIYLLTIHACMHTPDITCCNLILVAEGGDVMTMMRRVLGSFGSEELWWLMMFFYKYLVIL